MGAGGSKWIDKRDAVTRKNAAGVLVRKALTSDPHFLGYLTMAAIDQENSERCQACSCDWAHDRIKDAFFPSLIRVEIQCDPLIVEPGLEPGHFPDIGCSTGHVALPINKSSVDEAAGSTGRRQFWSG